MNSFLANKQIILGVTGGIAAYKSADLVRKLRDAGAVVRVVMTAAAKQFITPLTMQALSGYPVHDDLFDLNAEAAMGHIELARWADVIIVAPATADFIARLVSGEGNDLLSTLCLATPAPIAIAPAMNQGMWKNTFTQKNVQALKEKEIFIFGPNEGSQACGDIGFGRMLEPVEILQEMEKLFSAASLAGQHVVITAGPTREAIDPVRYISNNSSGKMGYALAAAAREAGARVTLISGPTALTQPAKINCINVVSAQEMHDAVMANIQDCTIFIGVAAVADYCCKTIAANKIAKNALNLTLTLERTPDIVASVAALPKRPFVVGFAAETDNLLEKAKLKLQNKKLDMIIANEVGPGIGFDSDENAVVVLSEKDEEIISQMPKQKLARKLIRLISKVVTPVSALKIEM